VGQLELQAVESKVGSQLALGVHHLALALRLRKTRYHLALLGYRINCCIKPGLIGQFHA
jgi:hypothetical protein